MNKGQEEMNNTISELKNTVEGIKKGQMKQKIKSVNWRKKQKNIYRNRKKRKRHSERILTEKDASQLSDTELKAMVIRKLTERSELKENYQKLQGNYNELTANYINKKRKQKISTRAKRK